jgi:hypothetical protein
LQASETEILTGTAASRPVHWATQDPACDGPPQHLLPARMWSCIREFALPSDHLRAGVVPSLNGEFQLCVDIPPDGAAKAAPNTTATEVGL